MNKLRRMAEDLISRYPQLFSSSFDKNKAALSQVSVIHARSLRNQLAGAITRLIHERGPLEGEESKELTLGEKIIAEVEKEVPPAPILLEPGEDSESDESKPHQETPSAQQ